MRFIKYIVVLLVLLAVYFDIKNYRIPNKLNGAGMIIGFVYSALKYGWNGMLYSLLGIFIPFVLLFVLFGIRVVGAGDIKLLCALGSFMYQGVFFLIIVSFVVAALMGVAIVIAKWINKKSILGEFTRIHLSVPIAVATVILAFLGGGYL